jgi:hypothetical protein
MLWYLIIAAGYAVVALLMMFFTYPEVLLRWAKGLARLFIKGGKAFGALVIAGARLIANGRIKRLKGEAV